ncbi:secretion protein HlyD [Isoptericola croceus]|uniref:secretion protein HlyD n=1 Tax=Isoptericola croceus TaxID=3031406 RepID=UPI0023F7CCE8|nr:secretion protein HlyD [Isoptericola croceus]
MGITRQYVFPALRIVIWAIIAAALVKLAFAGTELDAPDALQPTGEVTDSVIEVATGSVTNAVTVPASVLADPPVEVRSTALGQVSEILVEGGTVDKGDDILRVRLEEPRDPVVTVDPESGEETVREQLPKVTITTVEAPRAGKLELTVLKDQEVSVGEEIGTVSPGTLSVQGILTAEQQYRLIGSSDDAEVTLKGGPAPFTCKKVTIGAAAAGADLAEPAADATGTVTCRIPNKITAFAGQGAEIVLTNGDAQDVVVAPISAVLGTTQSGKVWLVDGAAEPAEQEVALGLTDGVHIEITDGLTAGDQILEFTPVEDGTEGGVDCDDMRAYDEAMMSDDTAALTAYEEACFG